MSDAAFYVAGLVAIVATFKAITQLNAVRALLYLIVSLLAVAVVFFVLGAPFAAALEVITYAGAIMVLFVFVVMMLNLGPVSTNQERAWLSPGMWVGPAALSTVLLGELLFVLFRTAPGPATPTLPAVLVVAPEKVGASLFGPYAIAVELASMLLLAGLVGAYHVGYGAMAPALGTRQKVEPRLRLVSSRPGRKAGAS